MAKGIQVPVTPALLSWARATSGLTLEEAADVLHEPLSVLAAWERGDSKPSLTQGKALAHAYRRPLAALLLPEVPIEPPTPVDFRPGVSGTGRRITRPILLAIRRARRMQDAAQQIFGSLDLPIAAFDSASADDPPESLAQKYRRLLGVTLAMQLSWSSDHQALTAWRTAVERLNVLVLQASMPVDEVRAFSLSALAPPAIVLNSADAVAARIFSLFHEFCHLALGQQGICDPTGALAHLVSEFKEERFCNSFAGNLLVPTDTLLSDSLAKTVASNGNPGNPLGSLAARYRVSRQVMWYRLKDVGLIEETTFADGWPLLGWTETTPSERKGEFISPPAWRRVLNEGGRVFVSRMLEALDRGFVSPADMVDWLEMKTSDIGKLEQQLVSAPE
jgi:Zn-dependent peptidase ImmA (M78 family)